MKKLSKSEITVLKILNGNLPQYEYYYNNSYYPKRSLIKAAYHLLDLGLVIDIDRYFTITPEGVSAINALF